MKGSLSDFGTTESCHSTCLACCKWLACSKTLPSGAGGGILQVLEISASHAKSAGLNILI